jgi:hypothetical protein
MRNSMCEGRSVVGVLPDASSLLPLRFAGDFCESDDTITVLALCLCLLDCRHIDGLDEPPP